MHKPERPLLLEVFFDNFKHLSLQPEEMERIAEKMEIRQVKSNAVLLAPGKICTHVYFVIEGGFVCRYCSDHLETPKTINFYLQNLHPFMACVDSFFTQQPTQCELRAISDATVLCMSKRDIEALTAAHPALKSFYDTVVIQALVEENELKLKIISYPAEQLYRYLRTELPEVVRSVPSKYIAEFMGITAEWLSKVKKTRS